MYDKKGVCGWCKKHSWCLWLLVIVLLLPCVQASNDICQAGENVLPGQVCQVVVSANCSSTDYFVLNTTSGVVANGSLAELDINNSLYVFGFNQSFGDYAISYCSGEGLLFLRVGGGNDMTYSLSISLFFAMLTLGVFLLPRYLRSLSKVKWVETFWRGCCFVLGLFMVLQWLVVTSQLSVMGGLGLENTLLAYIEPIMWVGIGVIMLCFVYVCFASWGMWKDEQDAKRNGNGEDDMV